MQIIKQFIIRFSIIKELLQFMWEEKLWWMVPFVILLLIVGLLLIFAQSSPIAPFLYTIF
ncbi:MAG: hypothetical protein A3B53_02220 [Candidatus Levybacteria bacterium RIFCSPLOWO2_01_FULL_42_15]|nr:MAG: hypothetical protein A3B53_02220 [Candidatus Levybacteria bacterium RIFCSPLOWO2_01_FULL_42_15]